jgi:hypothetical protein
MFWSPKTRRRASAICEFLGFDFMTAVAGRFVIDFIIFRRQDTNRRTRRTKTQHRHSGLAQQLAAVRERSIVASVLTHHPYRHGC